MIKHVYRFWNGMVAVFDEYGNQIPQYQGKWADRKDAILRDKPEEVVIEEQLAPTRRLRRFVRTLGLVKEDES